MDRACILRLETVDGTEILKCVFGGRQPEREEVVQLVYDKRDSLTPDTLKEALEMARTGDYYVDVVPFYT